MKIAIKSCFTTLVEDTTLIQNAATPYPVKFAFSKDWDGFAKTAFFEAGNVTTSGQMTFRCDTTPTVDLSVFIIRLEVGTDE